MRIFNQSKLNVTSLLRLVFLLVAILSFNQTIAQNKNTQIDAEFQRLVEKGALTADQASNYIITAQHTSRTSGIQHIYFSQAINGLIVNGTESSIHLFNGKKIKYNENLLLGDVFQVKGNSSPSITAEQAIRSVAQKMSYNISNLVINESIGGVDQKSIFNHGGISRTDIPAKLVYQLNENNEILLAWEFSIDDITSPADWWNFQVNASNGEIISRNNFIAACDLGDNHDHD
ncbi:MAG: hypothetical protein KUG68_06275, partial [Flavobacteriaceae bacterium]|nr:hypothetical protein [Flavobacteriaceae bacterium]